MIRECVICGDEFNPNARLPRFQWANRCNDCNDFNERKENIQTALEEVIQGQQAKRVNAFLAERKKATGRS